MTTLPTDPAAAGISADRLHGMVSGLSALGRKLPGSPAEQAACDGIVRFLAEAGLAAEVHEFPAYIGWPERTALTLLGPQRRAVAATGVSFAAATPAGGVRARIADQAAGQDVAGRIALVDGLPRYDACMAAARAGAVALIAVSHGPERHYVQTSPIWGAPTSPNDVALLPPIEPSLSTPPRA